ncbi:hypothetical protein [uncultured Methanoregula sp.]|uniref:hypothetical protein n=1 Tax=uncultured Methanoregula sp. TaxID=1005933 RepID=UPI002AABCBD4|nr:hypothetical protein [uncultured Methanoregula sp.]
MSLTNGNTLKQLNIAILRLFIYSLYGFQIVIRSFSKTSKPECCRILFYPKIRDEQKLADIVNRIAWYIPETYSDFAEIRIIVEKSIIPKNIADLKTPSSQARYIKDRLNIQFVTDENGELGKADCILIWKKSSLIHPKILWQIKKIKIVDPTLYFSIEAESYGRLLFSIISDEEKNRLYENSKGNFNKLLSTVGTYKKAYVFGTGPSLEKCAKNFDYSDGFTIICNTIVKNDDLMAYIHPHLLIFGDAQHHLGPSIYADQFRKQVLLTNKTFDFFIGTHDYAVPLLLGNYPELKEYIIGIEANGVWELSLSEIVRMIIRRPHKIPWFDKIPGHPEEFNFPSLEKMYTRGLGSVLPTLLIPIASSVCTEIFILGADGNDPKIRKPDEEYIWAYSTSCQFEDLKYTTFETHPAYFRDRPFTELFDIYCENYEDLLEYGENLGKKYYSLAPSYIPALANRQWHNSENKCMETKI